MGQVDSLLSPDGTGWLCTVALMGQVDSLLSPWWGQVDYSRHDGTGWLFTVALARQVDSTVALMEQFDFLLSP